MAAETGISPVSMENWDQCSDITPEKINELSKLMQKIQRLSHHKNWNDSMKLVRSNEKRRQVDTAELGLIQTCIDKLHSAIKVDSQQTLLERLESIARPLGLNFSAPAPNSKSAFIISEMFKVEVAIDPGGGIRDVKISHQGDPGKPVSCEDMVEILSQGRFDEFSQHLHGLLDIYRIPGDMKLKSKAFLALHCLEDDLNSLAQLQSSIKGVTNCIHKSPLGILLPRKGGCPMKLIYFVSPYDLLNKKTKSPHPMTVEAITEHGLGHSVTVCLEKYPRMKPLQSMPLMSIIPKDGKSLPKFQALTNVNSSELPASFVLVLPQPIPVAMSLIQAIQSVTDLDVVTVGEGNTLINLVLQHTTKGKLGSKNEFFVTLPDQQHVYYMSDISGNSLDQQAKLVSHIPFTHPTSVAHVLNILRQQLMFNTVVGSCFRPYAKQDLANSVVFELAAMSLQHFTVMFEHPLQDTMVTAELDLTDLTSAKFKVYIGEEGETICSDDTASKIFQRCLSIPVTLRSVIFKVSEELRREPTPEPTPVTMEISPPVTWRMKQISPRLPFPMDPKGIQMMQISPNMHYGQALINQPLSLKSPPMGGGGFSLPTPPLGSMLAPEPPTVDQDRPSSNPLLADLLDQDSPEPDTSKASETPVLSKLLEENSNTNLQSTARLASSVPQPPQKQATRGRPPKRRSQSEVVKGKSPKHRVTDYDHSVSLDFDPHRQNSVESDIHSQGSVSDTPRHHHLSGASTSSTGSTSGTTVIDLTNFNTDSPMKRLEHISDNFIPKGSMGHPPDNTDVFMVTDMHNHVDSGKEQDPQHMLNTYSNTVPKNEAKSTSLEELLTGSGEVSRTNDLSHQSNRMNSFDTGNAVPNLLNSMMRQNSHKNSVLQRQLSMDSNDSHSSFGLPRSVSYPSDTDTNNDHRSFERLNSVGLVSSKSCDSEAFNASAMINPKRAANSGILESPTKDLKNSDLRQLLMEGKKERLNNETDIKIKSEECKIKMTIFTRPNSSELLDITGGKGMKSSENTFDFNSDEDEPFHGSINSASPILSNKTKNSKLYQPKNKSDKYKRKESKSGDSGKRKRDRYEKQEKKYKKKKVSEESRTSSVEMYSATPVESEDKTSTKLKIFKNSLGVSAENSPKHSPSYREKDKIELSKKFGGKDDRRSSTESLSGKSKSSSSQKSAKNSHKSALSITVSRADSKLMNKTPTIKLKPVAIPTSSNTNVNANRTPTMSSPTTSKSQSSVGTPTSTTIGKIGAVSLATSGNSKVRTMTPPPTSGSVKVSTPNSAKTPPSVNKSIYSNNKTSASTTSSKSSLERKLSLSGRSSSSSSKVSNGSSKHSGDRKNGSPSVLGNRNTQTSSSKSLNSSSKGLSSTSPSFGSKNPATNAANVLSFLTNEKGISSLPRIPKISSASVNSSKTAATTATTVTMVTSVSSIPTTAKSVSVSQNSTTAVSSSRTSYSTGYNTNKSPINSTGKSQGTFNSQSKSANATLQGSVKQTGGTYTSPANRPPTIAPNSLGIGRANVSVSVNQSKHSTVTTNSSGKSPVGSHSAPSFNKINSSTGSPVTKTRDNSVVNSNARNSVAHSQRPASVKITSSTSSPSNGKVVVSTPCSSPVVTSVTKVTTSEATSESQKKPSVTSSVSTQNPVSSASVPNKTKARKNSLSAVIDKLTSAKCHVTSSGEGEDKKGRLEHSDSVEETESVPIETPVKSGTSEVLQSKSGSSVNESEESSESVKKSDPRDPSSGSTLKTNTAQQSSESISKKQSSPSVSSKESKTENNSRNLFTSILKNTSGNFVTENFKDDKENEVQKIGIGESAALDLCKKGNSPKLSPKLNGPSDIFESAKRSESDKDVFKVPTPKTLANEDSEDTENQLVRRKQRISTTKPVLSPASPASSPENLIIDFQTPVSPRTLQNRTNSPNCIIDISVAEDTKRVNNTSVKVCKVISSPVAKSKVSPVASPIIQSLANNPSPQTQPSPAEVPDIDDDLMNEAIMGFTD